ncbi:glycine oxidase ThiO [Actinoallomurus purpureus]|uniref:glycine oxidase ThiO n=1 Tax=Actinoallomurus purpureus TaxID=478114 RepID=UPI002093A062|nr:glycine oxidase ThiO [Actinoallomurus purpureus]MCO6005724.1 glycine oxidase ThiO [Actinoallomurus purpureus]
MHVVIVGGGVIGLGIAWRSLVRGVRVTVVDPEPASKASRVAAGMLTPVTELGYGENALLRLGIASRDRYPSFVAELEDASGLDTAYRRDGVLQVALDSDDLAVLEELRRFQESLGIAAEALTGRECRRREPMLAPSARGGLFAPDDGSIDPRRLSAALLAAVDRLGGTLIRDRAAEVLVDRDRATGVRLAGGDALHADQVVLAAGPWSHELKGLPPDTVPPVRPVKGQVVRLRGTVPLLGHTVRGLVRGSSVYLVPRADGGLVIGATQEEMGYDTTVTAGGVWELLRDARELVPGVTELAFEEVTAGLRPGSPDNAPILGPSALPGLLLATGHFRNGVLLTPVTADAMAETLATAEPPEVIRPFTPGRFRH